MEFREKVWVFADSSYLEKKVFCSICKSVFDDPYIASCGHTFCQSCVIGKGVKCPVDNVMVSLLVPNLVVADEVSDLQVHCRFGCIKDSSGYKVNTDGTGCPHIVKVGNLEEHEANCDFMAVDCPNKCSVHHILRKDLKDHMAVCDYYPCRNVRFKCPFRSTQENVEQHVKTCQYDGLQEVVDGLEKQVKEVLDEVSHHSGSLKELDGSVQQSKTHLLDLASTSKKSVQKIARLEEQQGKILTELSVLKDSMTSVLSDLKSIQQQLGILPFSNTMANMTVVDAQHLLKCRGTFVGHQGPVWDLCLHDSNVFSASSDNTIKVWNLGAIYSGPKTLLGHEGIVLALCCQGNKLFSGSSDHYIRVWNAKSFDLLSSMKAHEDPVCTLACNERYLYSGSLRSIKVWNVSTFEHCTSLPTQNHWVRALVVRGNLLYSGSYKAIKIWNIDTFDVVHVLQCVSGSVYSITITEKFVIAGTYENSIHVWNASDYQEMVTLRGHVGSVYALAVVATPGRVRLFSGSYDKTIRVWNMELFTCSQILARHDGSVTCLLEIGETIVSGAVDNTLKIWK